MWGRLIVTDALSRLPTSSDADKVSIDDDTEECKLHAVVSDNSSVLHDELQDATNADSLLQDVKQCINEGWPTNKKMVGDDLRPFFTLPEQANCPCSFCPPRNCPYKGQIKRITLVSWHG